MQWRTQKLAKRGPYWGSGGEAPSRRRQGGVGAEPPAAKGFSAFHSKIPIFSTLLMEKERTVFALSAGSIEETKTL